MSISLPALPASGAAHVPGSQAAAPKPKPSAISSALSSTAAKIQHKSQLNKADRKGPEGGKLQKLQHVAAPQQGSSLSVKPKQLNPLASAPDAAPTFTPKTPNAARTPLKAPAAGFAGPALLSIPKPAAAPDAAEPKAEPIGEDGPALHTAHFGTLASPQQPSKSIFLASGFVQPSPAPSAGPAAAMDNFTL